MGSLPKAILDTWSNSKTNPIKDITTSGKVDKVIITHKDRLSRVAFNMFEHLFNNFNTKIEIVDDELNPKTDKDELFDEIINLLHCFAMRAYSSRQPLKSQIKDLNRKE